MVERQAIEMVPKVITEHTRFRDSIYIIGVNSP